MAAVDGNKLAWVLLLIAALIILFRLSEASTRDLGRTAGIRFLVGMVMVLAALGNVGGLWLGWTGTSIALGGILLEYLSNRDACLCGTGLRLLDIGQLDKGLESIDRALQMNADDPHFHYARGKALRLLGRPEEAIVSLTTAVNKNSRRGEYHLELGTAYLEMGKIEQALEQLTEAIRWLPTAVECYLARAAAWEMLGRPREAVGDLTAAVNLLPNEVLFYRRGQALAALGEYALAEKDFSEALRRSTQATYYAGRAEARLQLGNLAGADSDLKQANRRGYPPHLSRLLEARIRDQQGEGDDAVAALQDAIADNPDDAEGYLALAEFLLTTSSQHRNPRQALAVARRAQELSGDVNWRAADLQAQAAEALGDLGEAVRQVQTALTAAPPAQRLELQRRLERLQSLARS